MVDCRFRAFRNPESYTLDPELKTHKAVKPQTSSEP